MKPAFRPFVIASAATVSLYCHVPSEILWARRNGTRQSLGAARTATKCWLLQARRSRPAPLVRCAAHSQRHLHAIVERDTGGRGSAYARSDGTSLRDHQQWAEHRNQAATSGIAIQCARHCVRAGGRGVRAQRARRRLRSAARARVVARARTG